MKRILLLFAILFSSPLFAQNLCANVFRTRPILGSIPPAVRELRVDPNSWRNLNYEGFVESVLTSEPIIGHSDVIAQLIPVYLQYATRKALWIDSDLSTVNPKNFASYQKLGFSWPSEKKIRLELKRSIDLRFAILRQLERQFQKRQYSRAVSYDFFLNFVGALAWVMDESYNLHSSQTPGGGQARFRALNLTGLLETLGFVESDFKSKFSFQTGSRAEGFFDHIKEISANMTYGVFLPLTDIPSEAQRVQDFTQRLLLGSLVNQITFIGNSAKSSIGVFEADALRALAVQDKLHRFSVSNRMSGSNLFKLIYFLGQKIQEQTANQHLHWFFIYTMTVESGQIFDIYEARNRIFHLRTQEVKDRYWEDIDGYLKNVYDRGMVLASQNPNMPNGNFAFRLRQVERDFRQWLEEFQL